MSLAVLPKTGYNLQFFCSSLYIFPYRTYWIGETAQLGTCLPYKSRVQEHPQNARKEAGHSGPCLQSQCQESRDRHIPGAPCSASLPYSMNFRPMRDSVSVARWMGPEEQKFKVVAWPPQAHMSMHTPEHTQTCIHTGRDSLLILKSVLNFQPLGCHVDLSSQPHSRLLFLAATTKYSLGAYCKFCVPNGTHYLYIQLEMHSCSSDSINSSTVAHTHMFGRDACTLPTL